MKLLFVSSVIMAILCGYLCIFPMVVSAEETEFTVDFDANVTSGTAPLPVSFNNLVIGNQVSGFWEMDNITYTQLPGPNHTFMIPGSYTVSLTVTDDTNTTLTETKVGYITVTSSISTTAISFSHLGMWGSNPVVITDRSSGAVVFVGKTSSKNIMLNSSGEYSVQIEPGGITDTLNSPDFGLYIAQDWAKKNIVGILIGGSLVLIVIGLFFRRK